MTVKCKKCKVDFAWLMRTNEGYCGECFRRIMCKRLRKKRLENQKKEGDSK
jgi:hypothetical protein